LFWVYTYILTFSRGVDLFYNCYSQAQAGLLEAKWTFLAASIASAANAPTCGHADGIGGPIACGQQVQAGGQPAASQSMPDGLASRGVNLDYITAAQLLAMAAAEADSAQPAASGTGQAIMKSF
jgi:hypothetical protein